MYQGNIYYVPQYHKLVYCHAYDGEFLILGGLTYFGADARTNIIRQQLHKAAAWKYEFKIINAAQLQSYPYLQTIEKDFAVTGNHTPFTADYLVGSIVMADEAKAPPLKVPPIYTSHN